MSHEILKALGLSDVNSGTYLGNGEWSDDTSAGIIEVTNPATNEVIAKVHGTSKADYETIVKRAREAFETWRMTPAPQRGEAVRLCGEALRKHKDALGSLVSLENGKIKPEGDGEVQEMIDIADFAVGQSRMMYGLTMHSERPGHRMYEQWHPLGLVGIIQRVQLPGRGMGLECDAGCCLRRHLHLEAVTQDPADRHRHHEDLQRSAQGRRLPRNLLHVQ